MFTLVGWQQSVNPTDVLTKVNGITDQHVTVSTTRIFVPPLNSLIAEYVAMGNTLYAAQLQSPSLRRFCLLDIPVLQQGGNPSGAESFLPHFDSPIKLDVSEGLEAAVNATAGALVATILAWLADAALAPVKGEIFTVHVHTTITTILGQWVNGALTFDQVLPVGKYQIVGANILCQGGNAIAFRFVIPGYQWRPGGLCSGDYGASQSRGQLYGGMGAWCEFDSETPPTLDLISFTAGAKTIVGYLNLIKTG